MAEVSVNNLAADRHPGQAAADRARRVLRRLCRQEIQARHHPGRERRVRQRGDPDGGVRRQGRRLRLWQLSRYRRAVSEAGRRTRSTASAPRSSTRCSSSSTRRRSTRRSGSSAFINGVGPRVGESAFGLIPGFAYTAPFEDMTIKVVTERRKSRCGIEDTMKRFIIRRTAYSLLSLFLLSVTIFFFVRVTGDPAVAAGRAGRQPGRYRRDPQAVRSRPAADRAILAVHDQPVPGRSRQVVLLPDAGHEPLSRPAAELAAARLCRDGPVAADRHSGRDHGLGAGRPVLGRFRQAVHAARPVAAVLPGRAGADPGVLGLSRMAAVIGGGDAAAPDHAGLRARAGISRPRTCG